MVAAAEEEDVFCGIDRSSSPWFFFGYTVVVLFVKVKEHEVDIIVCNRGSDYLFSLY